LGTLGPVTTSDANAHTRADRERHRTRDESSTSLVEKVRKLLTMAERTGNREEADAFSRKAAEMIAAHRLDPARVRAATGQGDHLGVLEVSLGRGAYVRARLALLQAVAEAHGCSVVFRAGYDGTTAMVAGFASDREHVEMLYTSLHAQASSRMAAERRSTGAATQRWRRSFLFGYAAEVGAMLAASHDDAALAAGLDGNSLPALRHREQLVAEFMAERFGRIGTARAATTPGLTGFVAGRAAASNADVGRPMVPSQRALGRAR